MSVDLERVDPSQREKVGRLVDLLGAMAAHPLLGRVLALKGGTAINLFWLDMPRLSVDLDFNCLIGSEESATGDARVEVESAVDALGRAMGYFVQRGPETHAGRTLHFGYTGGVSLQREILKVDLNFLCRAELVDAVSRESLWPGSDVTFRVLRLEEVFGSKVAALIQRTAPRDLFDVYALLKSSIEMDEALFHACAALYASVTTRFPQNMGERALRRIERGSDLGELRGLVDPAALATEKEMVAVAVDVIRPIADLDGFAGDYYGAMAEGTYSPGLIFAPWREVLENARNYPPALWKAKNVREHSRR